MTASNAKDHINTSDALACFKEVSIVYTDFYTLESCHSTCSRNSDDVQLSRVVLAAVEQTWVHILQASFSLNALVLSVLRVVGHARVLGGDNAVVARHESAKDFIDMPRQIG